MRAPSTTTPDPFESRLASLRASWDRTEKEEAEAKKKLLALVRSQQERMFEARRATRRRRVKKEKTMEWDGPFEPRRGVARGKSRMGHYYSGEEEGYNLCTSSDTEWDRPEEHASFRRREREVRRRVPGATAVSTDSSDFSPRSSDSEDSVPPVKYEIGDVFPWERVEEDDDVVPRCEGRVNLCTTDDETYTREDLGRAAAEWTFATRRHQTLVRRVRFETRQRRHARIPRRRARRRRRKGLEEA